MSASGSHVACGQIELAVPAHLSLIQQIRWPIQELGGDMVIPRPPLVYQREPMLKGGSRTAG